LARFKPRLDLARHEDYLSNMKLRLSFSFTKFYLGQFCIIVMSSQIDLIAIISPKAGKVDRVRVPLPNPSLAHFQ
jgi:hypothetical protein